MKRLYSLQLKITVMAVIFIVLAASCKKADNNLATVITSGISEKTTISARCGGEVTADGGSLVTERGVCWSTFRNPTTADSKTSDGQGIGIFSSDMSGLTPHAVHYVRAYATNSAGTAYGLEISFIADSTGSSQEKFTDPRDSTEYRTILIGTQTWMAQNLAYLPAVSSPETGSDTLPYYYVYGYDSSIVAAAKEYQYIYKDPPLVKDSFKIYSYKTYGVLYNWPAARVSCPSGWHLPSEADWNLLIKTIGSPAGGKLKEIGAKHTDADTTHWLTPNSAATNSSGFTALPGGIRYSLYSDSTFRYINRNAIFWSSEIRDGANAWSWHLYYNKDLFNRDWFSYSNGFSVRCLKY